MIHSRFTPLRLIGAVLAINVLTACASTSASPPEPATEVEERTEPPRTM